MKKVLTKKGDTCGCDKSDCVEKKEKAPEKYTSGNRECPAKYYMVSGVTQCGEPRDACIDCPESDKVDEESCPKNCNDVITENVPEGCTVKRCKAKPCPKCRMYDFTTKDGCGCQPCITKFGKLGGEVLFQERRAMNDADFNRNWADFKNGFKTANG